MPAPRGPRGAGAPQHRPAHHPARRTAGPTHGLTAAQARAFLRAAHGDGAYPVFVLAVVSGTRSAEIAAMRWDDVDLTTGRVAARASLVRVGGRLVRGPVKTAAGARGLPLVPLTRAALLAQRVKQGEQHVAAGADRQETGHVFTTRSGRPVEPRNLSRSSDRLADSAGLPCIVLHDLRRTAATLLKDLGVPARGAQVTTAVAPTSRSPRASTARSSTPRSPQQ